MTDLFETRSIKPMLIGGSSGPFDSPDYIFELKMDGERCLAYLDPLEGTDLRNKRNIKMLQKVPELSEIHSQVKTRCILDGELVVMNAGKPDFFEIQRRSLTGNDFKLRLQSRKNPASFIAFDVLYITDREITALPLMERKKLLSGVVSENERLAVSRFVEESGTAFYDLTVRENLEGIVAKRRDSGYAFDKRTKDWLKIKNLQDDDFVICGYIEKEQGIASLILGQYRGKKLVCRGHVTLGVSSDVFRRMAKVKKTENPPFHELSPGNDAAVWLVPELVCTVKYMMKSSSGAMRQPVLKGLRDDKAPRDCTVS
ncbi:RNA ligase family protein [Papillibacter cinnamivorans]|uniref:DNA ligase (ATP) n=1 Tax=Papillibacter cinnamivorans DSM 12816 TaxID=1122930 RepID=A0A1W1ZGV1_9FIRM|nr:RNA ligase family protein [Papillibacter cinnamivorans]SMC47412.1 bifunctional non-homologous end joining protein LigD [Papillibacter cinnamivorans DSM 12816]